MNVKMMQRRHWSNTPYYPFGNLDTMCIRTAYLCMLIHSPSFNFIAPGWFILSFWLSNTPVDSTHILSIKRMCVRSSALMAAAMACMCHAWHKTTFQPDACVMPLSTIRISESGLYHPGHSITDLWGSYLVKQHYHSIIMPFLLMRKHIHTHQTATLSHTHTHLDAETLDFNLFGKLRWFRQSCQWGLWDMRVGSPCDPVTRFHVALRKEHLSPPLIASANANAIVIDWLRETPVCKRFAGRNCLLKLSRALSDITSQVEGVNFLE